MERPTCATCPFWENQRDDDALLGECRRYAPAAMVTYITYATAYAVWPVTTREHWCGDHPDSPAHVELLRARPHADAPPPDRFVFGSPPAPRPPASPSAGYC